MRLRLRPLGRRRVEAQTLEEVLQRRKIHKSNEAAMRIRRRVQASLWRHAETFRSLSRYSFSVFPFIRRGEALRRRREKAAERAEFEKREINPAAARGSRPRGEKVCASKKRDARRGDGVGKHTANTGDSGGRKRSKKERKEA
ncbi:hypothetical protein BESB_007650 [Besnoitia besnoiti]|uniref:Uncharacterized protein n=1 Tax=Besnoitia besnoiti TaxID=94643 RepID=A0A2A9MQC5_BESBE|nr:hypothetical protein BESB_007650 [Besnoitia besnoiti]PFH38423.1 hypothetical protein BESB_007650 [Besnoitia besnoiti]